MGGFGEFADAVPSLPIVSRELASIVNRDYANETTGREYLDHLNTLTRAPLSCRVAVDGWASVAS